MELPTPVNFVIAFVVVLALIGGLAWLVRRFGATRLDAATRSRQPRLAVIDAAAVDGRRKLVIIRRDNVEHLLMIGGPTDVVVETNIVRAAVGVTRDAPAARNGGADSLPRAMPLPDPTPWPLQPEPSQTPIQPVRMPRAIADDAGQWQTGGEPAAPRAARATDSMAGPAVDFTRPAHEPVASPRIVHPEPAQPVASAAAPQIPPPDQSLAEMAQRFEAALRRPMAQSPAAKPAAETGGARVVVAAEHKAAQRAESKPAVQAKGGGAPPKPQSASGGSLEQEMASLLSRPGKT
ncbi:MAG: flagellar biosynthesis protein FliO [Alphaproteobacteria bacterium]|nr:flagellar biosynthesis protein FliO [Alphaproteobacteria bacterium]